MVYDVIDFLYIGISGAGSIFGSFMTKLRGVFELYIFAFIIYSSVRFLLLPILGRSAGSDRAGKKKNNPDGGGST